jgi:ADP-ribosylglycohydrolase
MPIPPDYTERVYAGVLGKIIGVYLGRPFEGWTYERLMAELGDITYYVHEKLKVPLIVTDDDIAGTFTFLRALPDYGNRRDLTPAQIGQTWLNYLIENRAVLWWGGLGQSTEHTAYLRLKSGIPAPRSGSIALNGKVVAEQIGAQIFIDGWAMVAPGNPELAADLARRAASVSHDGEAIYGAQVIAAMEAQAFVEPDIHKLLDTAAGFIPKDAIIYRLIGDLREWRAAEADWRKTRLKIVEHYGYDKYGGNCHMVPNHALVIMALLYGDDSFQKSLMIVNTSGWDTDCNSGNVGCLMGIKNGLAGIEAGPDFRGPVADRMYLSTADGGRAITDAVREAYEIANIGRALVGQAPVSPKGGARCHFEMPGSAQGFMPDDSPDSQGTLTVENVAGHSRLGKRSLALHYRGVALGRPARIATPTFTPPETLRMPGYALLASPSLYPGQTVRAGVTTDETNASAVTCRLYLHAYGANDELFRIYGPAFTLQPSEAIKPPAYQELEWRIPELGGAPVAEIGVELEAPRESVSTLQRTDGTLYLDYLTWDGTPEVVFKRPIHGGTMWRQAWVNGVDHFESRGEAYRLIQDRGTGLLIQGCREWTDYRVSADITPHLVKSVGLAARVQGMQRYYALLLCGDKRTVRGKAQLVKALDGETVLAEVDYDWEFGQKHVLSLEVKGTHLEAGIDGQKVFAVDDTDRPLTGGSVALVVEEGRTMTEAVTVQPV